ncbi:lysylphosphatidylglycerol synthase transmembrane domain-containing protein [Agaribacterium haliotis]|uniref:lysylphosphatidylglycerol synthase transmembrane domain-containing protein n=1 Tax=Agaribacterium haliotis TaxID=2013869 RepID=UPI0011788A85|nr:lysylphosphatidylglycerol synthase transmembrane domain-containing protein [Agaribacterium haliotis]
MRNHALIAAKALVASLFIVALVWWVQVHVGWAELLNNWQRVSAWQITAVVGLIFVSHLLRVARVHIAYRPAKTLRFADVCGVSLVHNTVSFLLPMRLGELALPLLSRSRLNIDYRYSATCLFLLRLFDANWLMLLLLLGASSSYLGDQARLILWAIVATTPLALYAAVIFVRRSPRFKVLKPLVERSSLFIMLYLLSGAIWMVKLSALAWLVASLGQLPLEHAWLGSLLADASALSPITGFANAGTFEAAFALPLLPLGYDSAALVSAALNLHLLVLITNIAAGLIGAMILLFYTSNKQVL